MEVHIYITVDSASVKPTEKWFGYVLECKISGQTYTREGFDRMVGTYHQTILTAMAKGLERLTKSCEVHLHTEDDFVLNMLENNLDRWATVGFVTTKGKPVANQEEWIRIWELSQNQLILSEPGKHEYSGWLMSEIERRKEGIGDGG